MILKYLPFVILTFVPFYGYTQSYNSSGWMNDKPFQDLMKSVKSSNSTFSTSPTIRTKVKDKVSWAEREEERQYNNRLNEIKNNPSDLLWYMNKDEYSSIIMSNSDLREKLKEKIWENRNNVIDLTKNPDIKKIVMNDPMLREYYELEVKKQDMRNHPESAIKYIKDPQITEVIKNDPELAQILAQSVKKKAEDEQRAEEQRLLRKKQEEERKEMARQAEIRRLQEERIRAQEQERQNAQEREKERKLSQQIATQIVPRHDKGLNKVGGVTVEQDIYNELYEDITFTKAKRNSAIYNTKEDLEKAWNNTIIVSKVVLKESYNPVKGVVLSEPIGKIYAFRDNMSDMIFPGTQMGAKVSVAKNEVKEEESFVDDVLYCLNKDALKVSSSNNYRQYSENEENLMVCVKNASRKIVDRQISHLEELTPVNHIIKSTRKIHKWFSNIAENIQKELNNDNEDF